MDIESIREFNKNLLKNYDEELVNKNHFFTGPIHKLTMSIETIYYSNDHDDYIQIARELEEIAERVSGLFLTGTLLPPLREEELSNPFPIERHLSNHNFTSPGSLLNRLVPPIEEKK